MNARHLLCAQRGSGMLLLFTVGHKDCAAKAVAVNKLHYSCQQLTRNNK